MRFSNVLLFIGCCCASVGTSLADQALTDQDRNLVEQGRAVYGTEAPVTNRHSARMQEEAKAFFEQLSGQSSLLQEHERRKFEKRHTGYSLLVFASFSLGTQGLDDIFSAVADDKDAVVVFRGVPEGVSFAEGVKMLQNLAGQKEKIPNVIINPTLFDTYSVSVVPTLLLLEDSSQGEQRVAARVEGISRSGWIREAVERGESGDLGAKGPVMEIAEPNLIDVAKQRLAAIDWEKKKEDAIARFWTKADFNELPRARVPRSRELDPSIIVTEDISAEGEMIVPEGTVINPLDLRPFTQALVIFDPMDQKQIELLERNLPNIRTAPGVQRITFIATRLDRETGWDSYKEITDRLDAPVFLLSSDIVSRFEVEYAPTVITSLGRKFQILELAEEIGDE